MRDRMGLFIGAAAGAITAAIVSVPCIRTWGVDGVNMALFISNGVNLLVFLLRFLFLILFNKSSKFPIRLQQ